MSTGGLAHTDPAGHIDAEFREAFSTWADFRDYVHRASGRDFFNADRAMHQILSADLAMRLTAASPHDWMLLGSLSLPARISLEPDRWPPNLREDPRTAIPAAHLRARAAFDLDLCALDVTHKDPEKSARLYGRAMDEAVRAVTASTSGGRPGRDGLGLGGLVRYSSDDLRVYPNGQVMGVVTAQPIDPRYGPLHSPAVADPIGIEIDIKPPTKVHFQGDPEPSRRSVVGLDVPGFAPWLPALLPTENLLADKICLLTGPVVTMREQSVAPWHRYKDLIDSYFVVSTCELDANRLKAAVARNWNLERIGTESLAVPYRVYGTQPGEPAIPWREGCDLLRQGQPQLSQYPDFAGMMQTVRRCFDSLPQTAPDTVWAADRGWHRSTPGAARGQEAVVSRDFPGPAQGRRPGRATGPQGPLPAPGSNNRRDPGIKR